MIIVTVFPLDDPDPWALAAGVPNRQASRQASRDTAILFIVSSRNVAIVGYIAVTGNRGDGDGQ
jgi:hypothetical protein